MANMRFYRKPVPQTGVNVGGSSVITFATLNGTIGYWATDNPVVQKAFQDCIEQGRYGISEISWDEFNSEYVQKKKTSPPLKRPWREELGRNYTPTLQPPPPRSAPVAAGREMTMAEAPVVPQQPPAPATQSAGAPFVPNIGRRPPM